MTRLKGYLMLMIVAALSSMTFVSCSDDDDSNRVCDWYEEMSILSNQLDLSDLRNIPQSATDKDPNLEASYNTAYIDFINKIYSCFKGGMPEGADLEYQDIKESSTTRYYPKFKLGNISKKDAETILNNNSKLFCNDYKTIFDAYESFYSQAKAMLDAEELSKLPDPEHFTVYLYLIDETNKAHNIIAINFAPNERPTIEYKIK